jgi:hypothetical protein
MPDKPHVTFNPMREVSLITVFTTTRVLLLNRYAQGLVSRDDLRQWHLALDEDDRSEAVKSAWILAIEAGVRDADIDPAVELAGLKPTHTPVVLLKTGRLALHHRGFRLAGLPGIVSTQAFLLAAGCFRLADTRRRQAEGGTPCHHWWHQDLSDPAVLAAVRAGDLG